MILSNATLPERWRTIIDYPRYRVSDRGRVISMAGKGPRVLKDHPGSRYPEVCLYELGVGKWCKVHHIVLEAFKGPRPGGMVANHINGVKTDNQLSNIEYVTPSYNCIHAFNAGLRIPNTEKSVNQYSLSGEFIATYRSQREANRQTGISDSRISGCCTGALNCLSAGGFRWEFAGVV